MVSTKGSHRLKQICSCKIQVSLSVCDLLKRPCPNSTIETLQKRIQNPFKHVRCRFLQHCTKKWSFSLRISSVNVTKSAGNFRNCKKHLLKKSLMENFSFFAVLFAKSQHKKWSFPLSFSVLEKSKNPTFEIPIIPQTLNINN